MARQPESRRNPMLRKLAVVLAGVGVLSVGAPLFAHHAFSAEFDATRPIKFQGTVTKVEWINPHTWVHVAVKGANGTSEEWMIEGGTPNTLFRRGITKDSLKAGAEIVVDGYQAKDGSQRANGRNLTLPDGRTLFLGSTGTGAPSDGKDAAEPAK
jgi:hypothetical protein